MTTRSVPAGSAVSACHTMVGSVPETSLSVRAMSRSRLMPGKTTTAAFMAECSCSSQHLNAVVLDHRIGEEVFRGFFDRCFRPRPVGAIDLDVEHLALADAGNATDPERLQSALDRLALRIENAGFQCDGDARLHFMAEITRIPSPRNLRRPQAPAISRRARPAIAPASCPRRRRGRWRPRAASPSRTPVA